MRMLEKLLGEIFEYQQVVEFSENTIICNGIVIRMSHWGLISVYLSGNLIDSFDMETILCNSQFSNNLYFNSLKIYHYWVFWDEPFQYGVKLFKVQNIQIINKFLWQSLSQRKLPSFEIYLKRGRDLMEMVQKEKKKIHWVFVFLKNVSFLWKL